MRLCAAVSVLIGSMAVAAVAATAVATSSSVSLRSKSVTSTPKVTVSPSADLVGGEQVRIALSGFPVEVTVGVGECPSKYEVGRTTGCMGNSIKLSTDKSGAAKGTFRAHPTARAAWNKPVEVCTSQCVVTAVESTKARKPRSAGRSTASASVSFAPGDTGGLADSSLLDLSWLNAEDGWALAQVPCDEGTCAVVARTTDGGARWQELPPTPALTTGTRCDPRLPTDECVHDIVFASRTVGYLFGPGRFMTTDGGKTWQAVSGEEVGTLAVAGGQAFRVVYPHTGCPGPCTSSLQASPVGSTAWHTVPVTLKSTGITRYQIVTAGSDVYVVAYGNLAGGAPTSGVEAHIYRSLDGGATFQTLTDPCVGEVPTPHFLTALAAAPGGVLEGMCTPRTATEKGTRYLVTSSDAGAVWRTVRALPAGTFGVIAAGSASAIALATEPVGYGPRTAELIVTTNGATTWKVAATDSFDRQTQTGPIVPAWLGFSTSKFGQWVADPHSVYSTADGGTSWTKVPFK